VRGEQDVALKRFSESIKVPVGGLEDVGLTDESTDEQIQETAKEKVEETFKAQIDSASTEAFVAAVKEVVDQKTESLADFMVQVRDKLAAAGLEKKNIEDGFVGSDDILTQFLMLPDTRFVGVPACNVVFPSDQSNFGLTRNHLQEPTRYAMILRELAGVRLGQPVYWAPKNLPGTSPPPGTTTGIGRAAVPSLSVPSSSPRGYSPPVSGPFRVSSPFGDRPAQRRKNQTKEQLDQLISEGKRKAFTRHEGTDIGSFAKKAINRRPVLAMDDGTVKSTGTSGRSGKNIKITHDSGIETHCMHLDEMLVSTGARVKRGDVIGRVGNTGTNDPHLHLQVRNNGVLVDPITFIISAVVSAGLTDAEVKLHHERDPENAKPKEALAAARAAAAAADSPADAVAAVIPDAGKDGDLTAATSGNKEVKEYEFLTKEEEIKGIIPYFEYNFDPVLALVESNAEGFNKDDFIQSLVESEFLFRRYETRQIEPINGPFNPSPMPGLPGLVVDKDRSIITMITSVNHTIVAAGTANTSVVFTHPRYWDEGDPYHWRGGKPGDANFVFPDYFLEELIDTNSYDSDPDPEGPVRPGGEPFATGRDRPIDKIYQEFLGCRAIPYFYSTRKNPATGVEVAYNKAIGYEGSGKNTLVGKYFDIAKESFEAAAQFAESFSERLGISENELLVGFLRSTAGGGNVQYVGPAFRSILQDEVRRLNGILNATDAFRG
jgi:hypothetical protein